MLGDEGGLRALLLWALLGPGPFWRGVQVFGKEVPLAADDLDELVHYVLLLEEVLHADHVDQPLDVHTVVALPNIHRGHVQLGPALGPPLLQELRVLVENLVVVEHAEPLRFLTLRPYLTGSSSHCAARS